MQTVTNVKAPFLNRFPAPLWSPLLMKSELWIPTFVGKPTPHRLILPRFLPKPPVALAIATFLPTSTKVTSFQSF